MSKEKQEDFRPFYEEDNFLPITNQKQLHDNFLPVEYSENSCLSPDYNYIDFQNIEKDLLCCICFDPLIDPIVHSGCGQMFCSKCIKDKVDRCPLCRKDDLTLNSSPVPKYILNKLDELKVQCSMCKVGVQRCQLKDHQDRNCPLLEVFKQAQQSKIKLDEEVKKNEELKVLYENMIKENQSQSNTGVDVSRIKEELQQEFNGRKEEIELEFREKKLALEKNLRKEFKWKYRICIFLCVVAVVLIAISVGIIVEHEEKEEELIKRFQLKEALLERRTKELEELKVHIQKEKDQFLKDTELNLIEKYKKEYEKQVEEIKQAHETKENLSNIDRQAIFDISTNKPLHLNVGGKLMTLSLQTFIQNEREPDNLFKKMFTGQFPVHQMASKQYEEPVYFIDCEPEIFNHIFDWLQYGTIERDLTVDIRKLITRSQYFGIDLRKVILQNSNLKGKDLIGLDFSELNLINIDFKGIHLKECNFTNSILTSENVQACDSCIFSNTTVFNQKMGLMATTMNINTFPNQITIGKDTKSVTGVVVRGSMNYYLVKVENPYEMLTITNSEFTTLYIKVYSVPSRTNYDHLITKSGSLPISCSSYYLGVYGKPNQELFNFYTLSVSMPKQEEPFLFISKFIEKFISILFKIIGLK